VLVVEVVYSPAAVWGKAQNHSIYNQRYANQASDVTGPLEESFLRGVCGIYKTTDCLRKTSLVQERMEICNYFVFNTSLAVRNVQGSRINAVCWLWSERRPLLCDSDI